jgi:hypothetical protein
VTQAKMELLIALAAIVSGTTGYLFAYAPAEVLGLLLGCVAFGMVLFRALPPDETSGSRSP